MYAGQEATVRTRRGTTDWFQIGKGVRRGCILSPCLFNVCAGYIVQNAELESRLPGETSVTSDNADGTILMAENEEELKSQLMKLMKVKEESEKVRLKLNIQKTKITASSPITSWQIGGETMETVKGYIFGFQNHCRW